MSSEKIVQLEPGLFARGVVLIDPVTGEAYNAGGGSTGGGSGSAGGTIGIDANGTQWLMVADTKATPATITYFKVSDGTTGTPVGGFTPDADQNGATAALQTTGNTSLANLDADLGAMDAAVATTDTGSFSLIALLKRALQNWTTLLSRVPALVSGRMPVDGSGVTQPISGTVTANTGLAQPLTDAQLRAVAVAVSGPVTDAQMAARNYALDGTDAAGVVQLAGGTGIRGWLSGIFSKLPSSLGQKTSAQSLSVVVASDQTQSTKDTNGTGAVRYTTDTTAVTGTTYAQIVCLTTTTFSLLTRTNGVGSIVGIALPPGTLLIGPITAYTLTSGAVAAYV